MQINEIFDISQYDEAFKFVSKNKSTTIEFLGDRKYKIVELPKPSLDDLKLAKRAEINQARDIAEQGGFEYMGKMFDSDPIACQRISCAAQAMSLVPASEENKIVWTCQDNTTIELTAAELSGLVVALSQWSIKCHTKASELKAQIDAAKTAEELEAIVWA